MPATKSNSLNKYSAHVTQPKSQGASQAMLYATGLTEADMSKAQVGIASVWYEGNPCNMHLNVLSDRVKEGVQAAGLVGMRFNTIGVSDGLSMGTDGMSYSLQSRDLIADSIETVMGAQWYDGCVTLPGCDKNMPGCIMALGRLNRPGRGITPAKLHMLIALPRLDSQTDPNTLSEGVGAAREAMTEMYGERRAPEVRMCRCNCPATKSCKSSKPGSRIRRRKRWGSTSSTTNKCSPTTASS